MSKSHFWLVLTFDGLTFVRQRFFGWLGRGTTPWEFLNQLISNLPFNTIFISYQHSPFCHCKSTLYLYSTYCCHCNIHLTFSNTSFHSNINKLQLSIKTITRTGTHTHTHQHISHVSYIHIYTHEAKTTRSYFKNYWIRSLLLVLYFSNWSTWWLIILTNAFLTPNGSFPCLNIWCRKILDV